MDPSEHERWKQHLEEELEAAFDLVRAGFRAQMRVLDQIHLANQPREAALGAFPSSLPDSHSPLPPAVHRSETQPPAPPANLPAARKRRRGGEVIGQVCDVLDTLPEVFDRQDLLAALPSRPHDNTLYAALHQLARQGWIKVEEKGWGSRSTRYRRLEPLEEDEDEPPAE